MITKQELAEAGFIEEVKRRMEVSRPTGKWINPNFSPQPRIETEYDPFVGRIGGMQNFLRNKEDLDNFRNKVIPLFCDPK